MIGKNKKTGAAIIDRIFDDDSDDYTESERILSDNIAAALGDRGFSLRKLNAATNTLLDGRRVESPEKGDVITRQFGDKIAICALQLLIARQARKKRISDVYQRVDAEAILEF